ncbi:MAG: DUF86 domain-containing protein [Tissierellia bacterium]|nr:DUF86 domain-containing protein [Tissierellia bacterium]
MIYGSAERFLHLAIECVIDIGNHIIANMGFRKPESNREIVYDIIKNNLKDMEDFRDIVMNYV